MTHRLMSVVAVLALASGCVVTSDGDGGSGGTGGSGAAGGVGGSGGSGGTGANGGSGGTGGGDTCEIADDCPVATDVCFEAYCEAGVCGVQQSAEGVFCDGGYCDSTGACVECIDGVVDCAGGAACVDGVCEDIALGGECGDNFCEMAAASGACIGCIQTNCSNVSVACASDMVAGACTNCAEWLNGGSPANFCAGSQDKAQALIDCACEGPCVED